MADTHVTIDMQGIPDARIWRDSNAALITLDIGDDEDPLNLRLFFTNEDALLSWLIKIFDQVAVKTEARVRPFHIVRQSPEEPST